MVMDSEDWASVDLSESNVLPLIRRVVACRCAPGDGLDDIFAIYSDRLILFSARRSSKTSDKAFDADGEAALRTMKARGSRVELAWDQIERIECGACHLYGSRLNGSREEGRELRIYDKTGASTRLFLPEDDTTLVRLMLKQILGERYAEDLPLKKYSPSKIISRRKEGSNSSRWRLWMFILLLVSIVIAFGAPALPRIENIQLIAGTAAALLLILLLISIGVSGTRALGYKSQLAQRKKLAKQREKRSKRVKRDLSGRRPLRSRTLGWTLKILGATIAIFANIAANGIEVANPQSGGSTGVKGLGYILGVALIYFGYRLCQRPGELALKKDHRAPILFLRPFEIDGRTDLNPDGGLAQLLGLKPFGWIKKLGPIGNVNPLRMIRLFFSTAVDHSEEQMGRYFRRFGPFIAIGRPGERFSPGGAARFYVNDADWQPMVLDLMQRSQFVVLQPSLSHGVRWEIEHAVQLVSPQRLLLCMTWFEGKQARYDEFRLQFERDTNFRLPRPVGDGSFLSFNSSRNGSFVPIQLRAPVTWPFFGCAVNFGKTLRPFFARQEGKEEAALKRPGRFSWFMQGALALVVWCILFLALDYLPFAVFAVAAAFLHAGGGQ